MIGEVPGTNLGFLLTNVSDTREERSLTPAAVPGAATGGPKLSGVNGGGGSIIQMGLGLVGTLPWETAAATPFPSPPPPCLAFVLFVIAGMTSLAGVQSDRSVLPPADAVTFFTVDWFPQFWWEPLTPPPPSDQLIQTRPRRSGMTGSSLRHHG